MVKLKGQVLDKRTGKIYSEVECSEENAQNFQVLEQNDTVVDSNQ